MIEDLSKIVKLNIETITKAKKWKELFLGEVSLTLKNLEEYGLSQGCDRKSKLTIYNRKGSELTIEPYEFGYIFTYGSSEYESSDLNTCRRLFTVKLTDLIRETL